MNVDKIKTVQRRSKLRIFLAILLISAVVYTFLVVLDSLNTGRSTVPEIFQQNLAYSKKLFGQNIFVPPLSEEILEIHRRLKLTNPGYLGKPVILPSKLPKDIQAEVEASKNEFKFNEFVSRLIPLDRELPDYRGEICRAFTYPDDLPKVSVILAFYNEPFTMLMRTVYSILNRSPPELIEEILLVDDCSDKGS